MNASPLIASSEIDRIECIVISLIPNLFNAENFGEDGDKVKHRLYTAKNV